MRTRSRYVLAAFIATAMALAGCSAGGDRRMRPSRLDGDGVVGQHVRRADRLRRGVAEGGLHPARRSVPGGAPGCDDPSHQLRRLVDAGDPADRGRPADVFASADEKNMQKVVAAGLASPQPFATNVLTLIVPSGNPAGVQGLADLANPSLRVVLCAADVPCGAASQTLLQKAGVTASVDSYEQNVTAVLTKWPAARRMPGSCT
jgi:molybdate transport system substrate-binding protein